MGRKQKVQKVNKNHKNFTVQEDFARVAKISQCWEFSQSCENFATLRNFAKLRKFHNFVTPAKMPASAASVASPIFALMLLFQLEFFMNELDS